MATIRQKKAFIFFSENLSNPKPIPLGKILIKAGYSIQQAKRPSDVTQSKGFQELLDEYLPDELLQKKHREVLDSKFIDHMVFPTAMSDEDITELVESVGGTVKKFQHGENATHVWFWSPNPKVRLDAIKLAYAVKGKLGANDRVPEPTGNTYNTFIQQNQINPNAPDAQKLVNDTLNYLMQATKRPSKITTVQSDSTPLTQHDKQ